MLIGKHGTHARCAFFFLSLTLAASAQDLELRQGGKAIKTLSLAQLKKMAVPTTLRLDAGAHNYWVLPTVPLLDQIYGKKVATATD